MKENEEEKPLVDYFELKEDMQDFSDAIFLEDKVKSGLKVAGKTAGNVGIFAGRLGFSIIKNMPAILEEQAKAIEKKKNS